MRETPVTYTIGTAATAVGKSKATISRAIASGRLSAVRNPDRSVSIEPVELFRVFPPATVAMVAQATPVATALERENQLLREMVDDLRRERDRLLSMVEPKLLADRRPWWRRWR